MVRAEEPHVEKLGASPARGDAARLAQAMLDCVVAITSNHDAHAVLSRLLAAACELTSADDAALAVLGRDGAVVEVVRARDSVDAPKAAGTGRASAAAEWLSRTRSPAAADDSALVPALVRGTVVGSIHLTRTAHRPAFTADDLLPVDAVANAVGFVIDGARSQDREELRRRWLEASAWLGEALRPPIDGQLALRRITEVARSISGAAATAFLQWPTDGRPVTTIVDELDEEGVGSLVERLLSSQALSAPPQDVQHVLVDGRRAIVLPLRSQIAVPAALVAIFEEGGDVPVAAEETGLLESLAGHASLALDRVQAAADRVDLEEVSRRDRVARDLHDVVIQRLFATGLQLEGMRMRLDDTAALERIDLAIEDIDTTIRHIREAILAADQATAEGFR